MADDLGAVACTRPSHGRHRCASPMPGHRVHVCACDEFVTWNEAGMTYREWLDAGRPPAAAEPPPPG